MVSDDNGLPCASTPLGNRRSTTDESFPQVPAMFAYIPHLSEGWTRREHSTNDRVSGDSYKGLFG